MTNAKAINILARLVGGATQPSWDDIRKAAKFAYDVLSASKEDEVHIQFNDDRTLPKQQPQGLDEAATFSSIDYVDSIPDGGTDKHPWNDEDVETAYQNGFKAGAEWRDIHIPKLPDNIDEAAELSANGAMISRQAAMYNTVVYNTGIKCFDHSDLMKQFKAGAKWTPSPAASPCSRNTRRTRRGSRPSSRGSPSCSSSTRLRRSRSCHPCTRRLRVHASRGPANNRAPA